MRTTLGIAFMFALCGAANLAHAADIPGVLGDPGTTAETTEEAEQPKTVTVNRNEVLRIGMADEKSWGTLMRVHIDHFAGRPVTKECYAVTRAYNPETGNFLKSNADKSHNNFFRNSVAELVISYSDADDESDKAGVFVWSLEPLNLNATSQIQIGNRTLQLTNVADNYAAFTSRKNRIALIDAIMRGRTATFSSHGPNSFIQRTFSLAGATAMAEFAARACDANSANRNFTLVWRPIPLPSC